MKKPCSETRRKTIKTEVVVNQSQVISSFPQGEKHIEMSQSAKENLLTCYL